MIPNPLADPTPHNWIAMVRTEPRILTFQFVGYSTEEAFQQLLRLRPHGEESWLSMRAIDTDPL